MAISNQKLISKVVIVVLTLLGLYCVGWFLLKFAFILVWFLIAGVLSLVGRPLTNLLSDIKIGRFRMPRAISAAITIICFFLIIAAFFGLFIPLVSEQARILSNLDTNQVIESLQEPLNDLDRQLQRIGLEAGAFEESLKQGLNLFIGEVSLSNLLGNTVNFIGRFVVAVFAITFMTFFFLRDRTMFTRIILATTPDQHVEKVANVLRHSKYLIRRYLVGLFIQGALFTLIVGIGLSILGIKYALLIAFFAGIVNMIPYLGPILAAIFGLFIAITSNLQMDFYGEMLPLLIKVYLVFWLSQVLDNYIFQPQIFSNVVSAHPLEIFLVVLLAGFLAGIPAMIVAIPSYTFLRIIAREFLSEFKLVQALTGRMKDLEKDFDLF